MVDVVLLTGLLIFACILSSTPFSKFTAILSLSADTSYPILMENFSFNQYTIERLVLNFCRLADSCHWFTVTVANYSGSISAMQHAFDIYSYISEVKLFDKSYIPSCDAVVYSNQHNFDKSSRPEDIGWHMPMSLLYQYADEMLFNLPTDMFQLLKYLHAHQWFLIIGKHFDLNLYKTRVSVDFKMKSSTLFTPAVSFLDDDRFSITQNFLDMTNKKTSDNPFGTCSLNETYQHQTLERRFRTCSVTKVTKPLLLFTNTTFNHSFGGPKFNPLNLTSRTTDRYNAKQSQFSSLDTRRCDTYVVAHRLELLIADQSISFFWRVVKSAIGAVILSWCESSNHL